MDQCLIPPANALNYSIGMVEAHRKARVAMHRQILGTFPLNAPREAVSTILTKVQEMAIPPEEVLIDFLAVGIRPQMATNP